MTMLPEREQNLPETPKNGETLNRAETVAACKAYFEKRIADFLRENPTAFLEENFIITAQRLLKVILERTLINQERMQFDDDTQFESWRTQSLRNEVKLFLEGHQAAREVKNPLQNMGITFQIRHPEQDPRLPCATVIITFGNRFYAQVRDISVAISFASTIPAVQDNRSLDTFSTEFRYHFSLDESKNRESFQANLFPIESVGLKQVDLTQYLKLLGLKTATPLYAGSRESTSEQSRSLRVIEPQLEQFSLQVLNQVVTFLTNTDQHQSTPNWPGNWSKPEVIFRSFTLQKTLQDKVHELARSKRYLPLLTQLLPLLEAKLPGLQLFLTEEERLKSLQAQELTASPTAQVKELPIEKQSTLKEPIDHQAELKKVDVHTLITIIICVFLALPSTYNILREILSQDSSGKELFPEILEIVGLATIVYLQYQRPQNPKK